MPDTAFTMFMYSIGIFYIIGIAIWISKAAAVKKARKITGKVINVIPQYRSAEYTVEITDDHIKILHVFRKRTWFNGYGINSTMTFYKIPTSNGYKYKEVGGYYTIVFLLFLIPWVSLIAVAFES